MTAMKRTLLLAISLFLLAFTANAQIHKIAEMNAEQIRNLNKEKTVVLIPGGILEEERARIMFIIEPVTIMVNAGHGIYRLKVSKKVIIL